MRGTLWSGDVYKPIVKEPNLFSSDAAYLNYIKTSPTQRLTRAMLKLFPNTPVSVDLSASTENITAIRPMQNENFKNLIYISGLSTKKNSGRTINSYLYDTSTLPVRNRVPVVKQILDQNGYTDEKRASMSNYYLGINFVDGICYRKDYQPISPYPHDGTSGAMYYIYLAQKK